MLDIRVEINEIENNAINKISKTKRQSDKILIK